MTRVLWEEFSTLFTIYASHDFLHIFEVTALSFLSLLENKTQPLWSFLITKAPFQATSPTDVTLGQTTNHCVH